MKKREQRRRCRRSYLGKNSWGRGKVKTLERTRKEKMSLAVNDRCKIGRRKSGISRRQTKEYRQRGLRIPKAGLWTRDGQKKPAFIRARELSMRG